jgi:MFS family permease
MNAAEGGLVTDRPGIRKLSFVGLSGGLIGVGICRFAYTPLVPVMIGEGWITEAEAGYLGAVNFTGYAAGAALAWALAKRLGTGRSVYLNIVLCLLSLAAAAIPLGFYWLALWRFVAGYGGAVLLVLVGPAVLAQVPAERWGFVTGVIFTGIGVGVAATGTIVPMLAGLGATAAWSGLAVAVLLLAVLVGAFWREPPAAELTPPVDRARARVGLPAIMLCLSYTTFAIGIAPHTIFWVDYLARGLDLGIAVGGLHWTIIGLLAAASPALVGRIAQRFGFARILVAAMAVTAFGVALPVLLRAPEWQMLSSILFGLTMPSTVGLFAGRTAEIGGRQGQRRLWWLMTMWFALVQTVAFYGMSALFEVTRAYLPLFAIAGAMLAVGMVTVLPVWGRMGTAR